MMRRNKYNVSPADQRRWNGRTYGSKAEMRRAQHWYALLELGEVEDIVEQPRLWLGVPENVYIPDFRIRMPSGAAFYEDVKGRETTKFKRDKKLWAAYQGLPLHVTKETSPGRFKTVECVQG